MLLLTARHVLLHHYSTSQRFTTPETESRPWEEHLSAPHFAPDTPASSPKPLHVPQPPPPVTAGPATAERAGTPHPGGAMGSTPSPVRRPTRTKRCQPHITATGTSPCAQLPPHLSGGWSKMLSSCSSTMQVPLPDTCPGGPPGASRSPPAGRTLGQASWR